MKRALITGILGQDGSYMAELLHKKGYAVYGIVKKETELKRVLWIKSLIPDVKIIATNILDKALFASIIEEVNPDEIYNFAGISNTFDAWDNLDLMLDLNARVPINILEIILKFNKKIKFFQASSCLIFGKDESGFQNEQTPYNPIHPYGSSKLYVDTMIKQFRDVHGLFCCSGIFFPHESERRGLNFFSRKITHGVAEIVNNEIGGIYVGNLSSFRDYGYAPDFMKAVYLMMHNDQPKDYVIGTGQLISMEDFVKRCFSYAGLDYGAHTCVDKKLYRVNDTNVLKADISAIKNDLGWSPATTMDEMISKMIDHDIQLLKSEK